MEIQFDSSKVVPATDIHGDDAEDSRLLKDMFAKASTFLESFPWCDKILSSHFSLGVGGVVAVFLFQIENSRDDVDDWVWIIVGDIPPAYARLLALHGGCGFHWH